MITELKVLSDLYTPPNAKGKQKCIKKNIITRLLINTTDIRYVEEVIDNKGFILKDTCSIKVDQENMRVKHNFDDIKKLVCPEMKHAGLFKTEDK